MPVPVERLGHRICQHELGLDVVHLQFAESHPILDMMIMYINMLRAVRLGMSGGPFKTPGLDYLQIF